MASAPELLWRLRYAGVVYRERQKYRRGRLWQPNTLRAMLRADLRGASDWASRLIRERHDARPISPALDDVSALGALFAGPFHAERTASQSVAADVRAHNISFFGETFRFRSRIPWNDDPQTGSTWPMVYHHDVPIADAEAHGDVKYVWELNRHQFLVDLAKVALVDDSRADADAVVAILRDWLDSVPYATGAPWACALEPAFRVWSWIWAYEMLRQTSHLQEDAHLDWLAAFSDHGRFLFRHLEVYASPYNHLIGEAAALFALGALFPQFRAADAWRRRGATILENTFRGQFHADGGSVEQSTFYHHATLGFYLLAGLIGRRFGYPLSDSTWAGIERALEFSCRLTMPDGRIPAVGGADDGKSIRFEHLPFWDFRPFLSIGAVLFERADFKFVAGKFWEDALWVLGPQGEAAFRSLATAAPARGASIPATGYFVTRSDWSRDADYVCFDCGPQAGGLRRDDVPSAAHGHADCLSLVVVLGGQRVLSDAGFFCYNGDPAWEVHFRKTAAHNTAQVDARDQATHISKMAWCHTFSARLEGCDEGTHPTWFRGSHDGFARGSDGVVHRRIAWLRDGGYVVVYDEFVGSGEHDATVHWQFAPGRAVLDPSGSMASFDDRVEMRWIGTEAIRSRVVCGGASPSDGWIAESLGVRVPAPHVMLEMRLRAGHLGVLTILADTRSASTDHRVAVSTEDDGGLPRATVVGHDWLDTVVVSTDDVPGPGGESRSKVTVTRERPNAPVEVEDA